MERLETINPRNVTTEESSEYKLREAVRAVVFDQDKRIAILDVARDDYFKLPGGGVEYGEDFIRALRRECLEEIGCDVEPVRQIGYTEEYWKEDFEKQVSYCYIANVLGEKGLPTLTGDEEERGYSTLWMSLEEAIERMESCIPKHWEGDYIVPRELSFLKQIVKEGSENGLGSTLPPF